MKAQLEKVSSTTQSSFRAFIYENDTFDAPWHFHPEFELTGILKSSGLRYVGDSVLDFEEGDLVLLGTNLPHCWKNNGLQSEKAHSVVLQWEEDLLGSGWMDKPEFILIRQLLHASKRGIKFSKTLSQKVLPIILNLLSASPLEKLLNLIIILDLLSTSSDYELLSGANFTPNLNFKTNERISKLHNFVSTNYQRQITLHEISILLGIGEEAFCRFFKKTFNKSFFIFLNEFKIKMACKYLIDSDLQVTEIAYRCGYESLPFFFRQFQKFIFCTPLVYRQKYENIIS